MNKTTMWTQPVPTANIAVNKSRIKLYDKAGDLPTYYLQKGQEFQIELFNPTTDDILAKIYLNNKIISQGGLVLRPGQRVFLERFLDNNAKFLFDTYEVSGSDEVKAAIRNNGDFRVEFFKAKAPVSNLSNGYYGPMGGSFGGPTWINGDYYKGNLTNTVNTPICGGYGSNTTSLAFNADNGMITNCSNTFYNTTSLTSSNSLSLGDVTVSSTPIADIQPIAKRSILRSAKSKSIETGRVEQGSASSQKLTTVDKEFEYSSFHKVAYKLLPISQKINTVEDLNIKKYCTNCGAKLSKGDKFCSNCGTKA